MALGIGLMLKGPINLLVVFGTILLLIDHRAPRSDGSDACGRPGACR